MEVASGNWKYQSALLLGMVAPLTWLLYVAWSSDPFVLGFCLLVTLCIAPVSIVALGVTGGRRRRPEQAWQWILLLLVNLFLLGTIIVQLALSDWARPAAAKRETKAHVEAGAVQ